MSALLLISLVCMALTIMIKWFVSNSLTNQKSALAEALDSTGQAQYRLKNAVKEVTTTNAEIDKHKRKIKTSQRKVERLQKEYKAFNSQAKQNAEMNAEKVRLANELKQRKGQ